MLLPSFTFRGILDYVAAATGAVLGFALFTQPMQNLTQSLKKN